VPSLRCIKEINEINNSAAKRWKDNERQWEAEEMSMSGSRADVVASYGSAGTGALCSVERTFPCQWTMKERKVKGKRSRMRKQARLANCVYRCQWSRWWISGDYIESRNQQRDSHDCELISGAREEGVRTGGGNGGKGEAGKLYNPH